MRADARDNRTRILAAADRVFGAGGEAASTEEVARLAGVGVATVFRHFPTKADLLGAVLAGRLEALRDRALALAAGPDAGRGFFEFFTEAVTGAASKLTILETLQGSEGASGQLGAPAADRAGAEMRRAFQDLLARAQDGGAVRRDVAGAEAFALMVGLSRASAFAHLPPDVRDGMLRVVFDGLRAGAQQAAEDQGSRP